MLHRLHSVFYRRRIGQIQRHGARLGLVWQLRTDRLEHQRVTQLICCHCRLGRRTQQRLRSRQTEGAQGLLGLPFIEQLPLAFQRLRADGCKRRLAQGQQGFPALTVSGDQPPGRQAIFHPLQGGNALSM
ncbi:hypothetical protein D3C80_1301550 [compost metagenome]